MESIRALEAQLHQLQALCRQPNPTAPSLQPPFLAAQQQFQRQVLPLGEDPSAAAMAPILTEMNRTFRLLAMDIAFLQTARQSTTIQQRQGQMIDKLEQLIGFAGALGERGR